MKIVENKLNIMEEDDVEEEEEEVDSDNNENSDKVYLSKSLSVQNQIQKWEKLVEVSIHFEKCIQKANILPQSDKFEDFNKNEEFSNNIKETKNACNTLIKNMIELQNLAQSNIQEEQPKKKITFNNKISVSNNLQKNFENYRPYRNNILQKWYSRTYVTSDKANLNVNKKIEDLLANKSNLITRSQTLNQHYLQKIAPSLITKLNTELPEEDENQQNQKIISSEIYDDTDFYLSLLQEVIDFKSNSSDKSMKDKINVLNLARQKMKRTVGLKASKGRRIRFTVHNKLVNFMPAINDKQEYEDNQRNVLFQSLFSS